MQKILPEQEKQTGWEGGSLPARECMEKRSVTLPGQPAAGLPGFMVTQHPGHRPQTQCVNHPMPLTPSIFPTGTTTAARPVETPKGC